MKTLEEERTVTAATELGADILLVEDDPNDAELISRAPW